jgi:hypothetical protein
MNPLESWQEERRSAFLYRVCADAETDPRRSGLFLGLAGEAEAQAAIWRAQLTARGHPAPRKYVPDGRTGWSRRWCVAWVRDHATGGDEGARDVDLCVANTSATRHRRDVDCRTSPPA